MIKIIDTRGSGKTNQLMNIAKDNNAIFVCSNPHAMEYKAKQYNFNNIKFISYHDFVTSYEEDNKYVIDEVEEFIKSIMGNNELIGYSLTIGD